MPKNPKKSSAASFSWNWQKGHEPKSTTAMAMMTMLMLMMLMLTSAIGIGLPVAIYCWPPARCQINLKEASLRQISGNNNVATSCCHVVVECSCPGQRFSFRCSLSLSTPKGVRSGLKAQWCILNNVVIMS